MAAEPQQTSEQDEPANGKQRLLIIGGAAAAVLIVIAIGLVLFLRGGADTEATGTAAGGREDTEQLGSAFYVPLQRDFIFNVPGAQRDRVAQISVQLMVRGTRNERLAQENIPLIEGTLLQVFSRATAERLNSAEGKREIRLQALDAAREAMRDVTGGSPVIEDVLFTGFVMQ